MKNIAAFRPMPDELLQTERKEMQDYFPHWSLTVLRSIHDEPLRCGHCGGMASYHVSDVACVDCNTRIPVPKGATLAWIGHMPVLLCGCPRATEKIARHPHPSYPIVHIDLKKFLLVPIIAGYPPNWPQNQPVVRYDSHLATLLELGSWAGSTYHMLGGDILCLYYPNHWRCQTMRQVLQQRVVNHLASLIKCADGESPQQAFIGRIHDEIWQPKGA